MISCQRTPKISNSSKRKSNFHLKLRKPNVEAKKNMSNSLKINFFVHWVSFDCKWDLSLMEPRYEKWLVSRWLKKTKETEKFSKKRTLKQNSIFLIVNFPMSLELVFFIAFSLLGWRNWSTLWHEIKIWNTIFIENILIWRKITLKVKKSCQISRVHTKLQSSITPRKKRNSKKFF